MSNAVLAILFVTTASSSFVVGLLYERVRWNMMIQTGKIPEPVMSKKYKNKKRNK